MRLTLYILLGLVAITFLYWGDKKDSKELRVSKLRPEINLEMKNKYLPSARTFPGCDSGHWIDSVSDDGEFVQLEDGSIWEVDVVDAIYSNLWLPTSEVVACDDRLINTDDNEAVFAVRIR
jgi:hypothetical protein